VGEEDAADLAWKEEGEGWKVPMSAVGFVEGFLEQSRRRREEDGEEPRSQRGRLSTTKTSRKSRRKHASQSWKEIRWGRVGS